MKTLLMLCLAVAPFSAFAEGNVKPGTRFVENWDQNADGKVTAEELREKRSNVFYTFDSDEDGKLSAEEYTYFNDARKADMEGNAEEGKGGMKRVQGGMKMDFNDVDKDGKVSRDEFLGQVDVWFTAIDRNMDAIITTADFGPRT